MILQDHGALIDAESRDGMTALSAAVRDNKAALVQLLLRRGADPDRVSSEGGASATSIAQAKASSTGQPCVKKENEKKYYAGGEQHHPC